VTLNIKTKELHNIFVLALEDELTN